jgi:hypothetical protein
MTMSNGYVLYILGDRALANSELTKVLVNTMVCDQALLDFLFRVGIYQDIPDSPFTGMEASKACYPAQALRRFFAGVHFAAPHSSKADPKSHACWTTYIRVLCEAYIFFEYI